MQQGRSVTLVNIQSALHRLPGQLSVGGNTFYKYFASPEALVRAVAVDVANELIKMAEKAVQHLEDPAERVSCGMRLVSGLAFAHPVVANFLVRLGWPNVGGAHILVEFVERDLQEGLRRGRFIPMPIALALNIVAGIVVGAADAMLKPGCDGDFAEQSAAAALRALGVAPEEADRISRLQLGEVEIASPGLLAEVLAGQA